MVQISDAACVTWEGRALQRTLPPFREYDWSLEPNVQSDSRAESSPTRDTGFRARLSRAVISGGFADDLSMIGRDIRYARALRGYPPDDGYRRLKKITWIATILWIPLSFAVSFMFVRSQSFLKPYPWNVVGMMMVPPGLLIGVIVGILWLVIVFSPGTQRVGTKVQINPNCVKCGYNLRGTVPMIAPSKLRGTWIGPECCPECGLHWPLIPKELGGQDAEPKLDSTPAPGAF